MFYVYILQSLKDGQFYTGHTVDLNQRLKMHNSGQVHSTRNRRPFELIYSEKFASRNEAIKREKYLKSLKGAKEVKSKLKSLPGSSMVERVAVNH